MLDRHGVNYDTITVTGNPAAMREMVALSGQHRAPTLDWQGEILADFGAAELEAFLAGRAASTSSEGSVDDAPIGPSAVLVPVSFDPDLVEPRAPFPPFTEETARKKVQTAEDAWNTRDPHRVAMAYTPDSEWRNRSEFPRGRREIVAFLTRKWQREHDYRLRKELWAFTGNRIAVRFMYEWHDDAGQWWRSHGNENWEFAPNGLMARRFASINDEAISEADRQLRWARS